MRDLVTARVAAFSPVRVARTAGIFYISCIILGAFAEFAQDRWSAYSEPANFAATLAYIVVTALLFALLRPVNGVIASIAALCSLAGCAISILKLVHLPAGPIKAMVFFGFYCVLMGYLIVKSSFMPSLIGGLMMLAGLGWLTFLWPPLAHTLSTPDMVAGFIGEGSLTVWLLIRGVDREKWLQQASQSS